MSAEVEAYAPEQYQGPASSELEQWGRDAHLISAVAMNLVKTSFVPASYNGDPAQATAAILTGQEIGLKPMAALRSIDVIQGVPAMRAIAMRALVQSHGHEIWTVESTRTRAVVRGQRKGSDKVETSEWTIERAREMNLMGKKNYKEQPTAMLLARATSECARLIAADVLLGVPYSIEEIQDLDLTVVEDAPRKAPARRTTKRAALPPADEPPLPSEEHAVPAAIESKPDEGEAKPAEADEPAAEVFDEKLAAKIQADLDAERAAAAREASFEEPGLDWDAES